MLCLAGYLVNLVVNVLLLIREVWLCLVGMTRSEVVSSRIFSFNDLERSNASVFLPALATFYSELWLL